jgi:hypothetical protein
MPLQLSVDDASPTPNRQFEELHGNDPTSIRRARLGHARMEHQAPYQMPVLPSQRIAPFYSVDDAELIRQRQLRQYLFTQTTASNHMNDTNDLVRHALTLQQNQDAHFRMALPPSQQNILPSFSSDATDLTQRRQLEQSILSQVGANYTVNDTNVFPRHTISQQYQDARFRMPLPPSQHPFTSDSQDAALIQQRQLENFILSQANANASNQVNYNNDPLHQAFDRQNQGAQYNQLVQNELNRINHSSSMIPVQQVHQQNYQVKNFALAASPSDATTNVQVRSDTSALMERPPVVPILSTAGLTSVDNFIVMSSTNRASLPTEEAPQNIPPIRNDAGKAKTVPIDASDKRTPQNSTDILIALGNRTRKTAEPYIDVSDMARDLASRPPIRGGVVNRFPEKLHQMLKAVEVEGESHIISFYPHGRAFAIHDGTRFETEILPKFLPEQGKLFSFVRQLNLYGFIRINSGPDSGGYYHELFLKGRPSLTHFMGRVGASKTGPKNGGKKEKTSSPKKGGKKEKRLSTQLRRQQPNFYDMKCILPVPDDA